MYANITDSSETNEAEATFATSFELETGIAIPNVRPGGRGAIIYPFDEMNVGHSFHIPVSEKKPNPAKSIASTVSNANARYAVAAEDGSTKKDRNGNEVPIMINTRKFIVRKVGNDDPKGPGARVFRVK